MALTAELTRRIVSEPSDGTWELVDGQLREKPTMSARHHDVSALLGLDLSRFRVQISGSRLARTVRSYFVPDVAVIPIEFFPATAENSRALDYYDVPLPLVVEVWSPSTGGYDIDAKLPEYQARKDQEIWRVHSIERSAIIWRQQPDGSYMETHVESGVLRPAFLPNVAIELSDLFI